MHARSTAFRLFVTVWIVFSIHFASDVVRESYLAITLGESLSIRVDEYMGLHPDLFHIEGRGAYINSNPGASMMGAVPYALARPVIDGVLSLKPELAEPKPPSEYDDPRPNRNRFMNEARERGLDIKLALAAASMQVGLMAPAGALAAVIMFIFLRGRLRSERTALALALLYAFGTPVFFRSAFLNQNLLLAHLILGAYVALTGLRAPRTDGPLGPRPIALAGLLLGLGVLNDYSAVPMLAVFAIWVVVRQWRTGGPGAALRGVGWLALGGALPAALLFGYQWAAFGHPLFPAQRYMPDTQFSVIGWNGLTLPDPALLLGNLLSPRYGLLAFCPMLALAAAAPFLKGKPGLIAPRRELWLIFGASLALYLFNSANQFAHLQFNTGVRYMVPAVPLLFIALVPVLLRAPRVLMWLAVIPTVVISWSVAMTREAVPTALLHIFIGGFELPFLAVLSKTAAAYAPFIERTGTSPLPLFALVAVVLWILWSGGLERDTPQESTGLSER